MALGQSGGGEWGGGQSESVVKMARGDQLFLWDESVHNS